MDRPPNRNDAIDAIIKAEENRETMNDIPNARPAASRRHNEAPSEPSEDVWDSLQDGPEIIRTNTQANAVCLSMDADDKIYEGADQWVLDGEEWMRGQLYERIFMHFFKVENGEAEPRTDQRQPTDTHGFLLDPKNYPLYDDGSAVLKGDACFPAVANWNNPNVGEASTKKVSNEGGSSLAGEQAPSRSGPSTQRLDKHYHTAANGGEPKQGESRQRQTTQPQNPVSPAQQVPPVQSGPPNPALERVSKTTSEVARPVPDTPSNMVQGTPRVEVPSAMSFDATNTTSLQEARRRSQEVQKQGPGRTVAENEAERPPVAPHAEVENTQQGLTRDQSPELKRSLAEAEDRLAIAQGNLGEVQAKVRKHHRSLVEEQEALEVEIRDLQRAKDGKRQRLQ